MNNLYSVVSNSLGFTRAISVEPEKFPVVLEDILIKPNDFLTENNFNFSLSCLYQNFLSIASDSYVYNPNIPVTNPFFDSANNLVGTLCGTLIPNYNPSTGLDSINYYVNGIPHSNNAFKVIYTSHDFVISGDYLTVVVGMLSATTLSPVLSSNIYYPALGVYNYSLSSILGSAVKTNNSNFPDQGVSVPGVVPNFGFVTKELNKNLNLKFNSITKLKIVNERMYVLDNVSNKFLIYDISDLAVNRTNTNNFEVPLETLGFATSNRHGSRKISSFSANENYIALFNVVNNAVSIFSTNLSQLFDFSQDKVSSNGIRNTEVFADIEFDTFGNLYILTQNGSVYVYSVTNTALTLINSYNISPKTTSIFSSLSAVQVNSETEIYKKLSFSKSDTNVYYVATTNNIYKRFVDRNVNIGQFNSNINNTTYYSTLSNIADPFNTLMFPNSADYPNEHTQFDFYRYNLNSINSVKYSGYELFSVCFTDNCTYTSQNDAYYIGNIGTYHSIDFITANNIYGVNPVSASGITFIVDKPNYINLNNTALQEIEVYTFEEIAVKSEEFITDFAINKSFRKLLYTIFNYQTYQAFRPVVDIDINNNALYKKLEYIVSYNKNQNITNFDNFIGLNEITSTIFLNRCFSKVYELLKTLQDNYNSRVINVYPRYSDSVLLNQTSQKFASLYNDSKQFISGEFDTQVEPLNTNLCVVESPAAVVTSPVPSSTPASNPVNLIVTPTPTPAPSPTLPPSPTPSGYVLVNKTIQHVATVYLNNEYVIPVPVPPFPNYDIKPLSAIYDGTGIDTIVSEFSAYFDQAEFYYQLANADGDYTKLVGSQFGDYVLQSYTPSSNTEYTIGGQGCLLDGEIIQGITPTPTPSITPSITVTPSITPSNTVTPTATPTLS